MVGSRLKELAQAAGFPDLAKFARRAGIDPQTAQKQATRDSIPPKAAAAYIRAAHVTGADLGWLLTGRGAPPRRISGTPSTIVDRSRNESAILQQPDRMDPLPIFGWDTSTAMPIRETIVVGGAVYFMLTERVIDYTARPGYLSPQAAVFSFYMQSDDMEPRYEKGDRLLVNCSLPVLPDKDVVLLSTPDAKGHQRAIVRRLVRESDDHWRVKAYSPARTYNEPKAEYPEAHRIEAARGR